METLRAKRTRLAVLAALTLIGGLVGSCANGADPRPVPTLDPVTSSAPSPAATDDYTLPPRPEATPPEEPNITGTAIEDAAALAEYYVELYPYVKRTGDTTAWEKWAHPECDYCNTVIESAEYMNKTGAWTSIDLEIIDRAAFISTGRLDFRMDFLVNRSDITQYDPKGTDFVESGENSVVIGLVSEGGLKIRTFDIFAADEFGKEEL